jgi:uncharacterized protein YggE
LAVLLLFGLLPGPSSANAQDGGIHVTGTGEVAVVPDLARVNLDVRREGADAAALKSELDGVAAAVLALASTLGIEDRDVTAATVNIHPRYRQRDGESVVDGVVAVRSIAVTLRELDRIAEFIDGALARGVNGVNGVELDASNRAALDRQALDLAIDDATRQAEQIAARFGVGLGALLEAGGAGAAPRPIPMMMDTMVAGSPEARRSFEPGLLTIRREIAARFAIDAPAE